jgi:Tfp pilus assembly protein PilV
MALLEVLVFVALWGMLAVTTMQSLAQSREMRGNARDRTRMALIAQEELERVRALPAAELREETNERTDPAWPGDVKSMVTLKPVPGGNWSVEIRVDRKSFDGKVPVRLATIRRGAGQ